MSQLHNAIDMLMKVQVRRLDEVFRSREVFSDKRVDIPFALRLDGVRFSRVLADFKPRSFEVHKALLTAAMNIMEELGCCCSYVVSDEINVLCLDYVAYGGRIEKLVSISASIASATVSIALGRKLFFDSRIIVLKSDTEVPRYILYRARVGLNNFVSEIFHRVTGSRYTPPLNSMITTLRNLGIDIYREELWKVVGTSIVKKLRIRAGGRLRWSYEVYPGFIDAIICSLTHLSIG